MWRLSKPVAALAAAALLIVGGSAYALASASGGTITVCVSHTGGTLYKAKKCHSGDKKLSWNRVGPQGARGSKGSRGQRGSQGVQGAPGAAGSALAYAEVLSAAIQASNSKNVAQAKLSNPSAGVFCFSGLSFTPHNVVVTQMSFGVIQARLNGGQNFGCPGAQAVVITSDSTGSIQNEDFMVEFN